MAKDQQITRNLAQAQIDHAAQQARPAAAWNAVKTVFHIYTQFLLSVDYAAIVARYFEGATIYRGLGLDSQTQSDAEQALIIEVVSSASDALQRMVFLAGDLRVAGDQISVLLTQQPVTTFEITEQTFPEYKRTLANDVSDSPSVNPASRAQAHRFANYVEDFRDATK